MKIADIKYLLKVGFTPNLPYNPQDNWLGCSRYSPDRILTKGKNQMYLSLQGILTGFPRNERESKILKELGARYAAVLIDGAIIWETFFGEDIPEDVFQKLIA